MESLKFLMVSTHYPPTHLGGDARFVEYLSNELVRSGHEVHVLHSPYAYALLGRSVPRLDEVTAGGVRRHTYLPSTGRLDPLLSLAFGQGKGSVRRLQEICGEIKPDVVHWHNTKGFIGLPFATGRGASLYTAHDYYLVCPKGNLIRPGFRMCQDPILCHWCIMCSRKPPQLWRILGSRVANPPEGLAVISPSEFLARRLRRDGIRVDHILRSFVPDRGRLVHRERGVSRIVYLGALEMLKGPLTLLDAFSRCRDMQGFELSLFGEGTLRRVVTERVSALSLGDRVRVHGFVPLDELTGTLEETAAVILPSEMYENAPLVALEALSMGIPVIGSDIAGISEILRMDSGSTLFAPGDRDRLAHEIVALWDARGDMSEKRRKARETYEKRFSPDAHLKDYLSIVQARL